MKKEIHLSGRMALPPEEGERAIISVGGSFIYTSPVVEIIEERADYVCFETMNSLYKVSLQPVPVHARILSFLNLCA